MSNSTNTPMSYTTTMEDFTLTITSITTRTRKGGHLYIPAWTYIVQQLFIWRGLRFEAPIDVPDLLIEKKTY